jgi:hypothetical protein
MKVGDIEWDESQDVYNERDVRTLQKALGLEPLPGLEAHKRVIARLRGDGILLPSRDELVRPTKRR